MKTPSTNDFGYTDQKGFKQKRDEARNILRSFSKTKIETDIAFN